jgi:hypothetical protein
MMFLDCPSYLDTRRTVRCGLPAEVRCRFTMRSTDGPLESAMIKCPVGHWFTGPIESLTWEPKNNHHLGTTGAGSSARHDKPQGTHDSPAKRTDPPPRIPHQAGEESPPPERALLATTLSRPAELWITAMRPHRGRTAPPPPY